MTKKRERLNFLDIAKLIAILFILLDHIQYYTPVNNIFMTIRITWLSFFLQIFFISAGITSDFDLSDSIKNFGQFCSKKFKSLIIPYIIWCFCLNYSGNHDINFFLGIFLGSVDSLEYAGVNSVLWFLPSLFMANIIIFLVLYSINKCKHKNKVILLAIVSLLLFQKVINTLLTKYLYFGLKSAFIGSALMLFGYLIKDFIKHMYFHYNNKKKLIISVILFIISTIIAYINMPILFQNKTFIGYRYSVWMAQGYFGKSILLFLLTSIGYSISIMIIAMFLERFSFLEYCGRHTLLFMVEHIYTHAIVAEHILPLIVKYFNNAILLNTIFFMISFGIIIITFPFIDKYMPYLYKQT